MIGAAGCRREGPAGERQGEGRPGQGQGLRSEVNSELNFPPKLRGARSRLYRRRFLQVNTRWKALAEIYTMHSFAPFSNMKCFVNILRSIFNFANNLANTFQDFCSILTKIFRD